MPKFIFPSSITCWHYEPAGDGVDLITVEARTVIGRGLSREDAARSLLRDAEDLCQSLRQALGLVSQPAPTDVEICEED